MEYNAIIRDWMDAGSEQRLRRIVGRVLLTDLKDFEGSCVLRFGCEWKEKVDLAMCDPTKPLQIYTSSQPDLKWTVIPITVYTLTGKQITFSMKITAKTEMIKERIQATEGIPPDQQRLIFQGRQMENGQTIDDYLFTEGLPYQHITLHLVLRLRGGGFVTADVEGNQVAGVSGHTNLPWQAYGRGMSMYGVCPNRRCKSKQMQSEVVFQADYDTVILTSTSNKFLCTACHPTPGHNRLLAQESGKKIFSFTPSNFVVSVGRTLFRFKKSGDPKIKTVLMESLGRYEEYKTFKVGGGTAKYDFIEIKTVRPEESPYGCVGCDREIRKRNDEVLLNCGHAYHSFCAPKEDESCLVCNAKRFSVEELMIQIGLLSQDKKCRISLGNQADEGEEDETPTTTCGTSSCCSDTDESEEDETSTESSESPSCNSDHEGDEDETSSETSGSSPLGSCTDNEEDTEELFGSLSESDGHDPDEVGDVRRERGGKNGKSKRAKLELDQNGRPILLTKKQ